MKLQFKHQPFQAEAAAAVCDVFNGQPYRIQLVQSVMHRTVAALLHKPLETCPDTIAE